MNVKPEISVVSVIKEKIAAVIGQQQTNDADAEKGDDRPVIVRSRDAGVIYGLFAGRVGSTVKLTKARQMWRWKAVKGGTLLDCAKYGVIDAGCKFSEAEASVQVFGACALIDCERAAARSIEAVEDGEWS